MTQLSYPVLAQIIYPAHRRGGESARAILLALGGAAALTAAAKIQIPFYPVPQTLQTLVVLLLGAAYGVRLGAATVALYLAAGAAGLPIFAGAPEKGIGIAYMVGPTGGYLFGFVAAAAVCGMLAARGWDEKLWKVAAAMCIGNFVIYACGLLWLGAVIGWDKPLFALGMYPFLLGDAAKIIFAAAAVPPIARAIRRRAG